MTLTGTETKLIQTLTAIQAQEKYTDALMGERLGIHAMSWNRIKKGRLGYSKEFVSKALRAFPEVAEAVLIDIFGADYRRIALEVFRKILLEMEAGAAK